MLYIRRVLLFVLLSSVLLACGSELKQQSPVMLEVGPTNVTEAEFVDLMDRLSANINNFVAQTGSNPEDAREILFRELMARKVFLNEAAQSGYGFESEDVAELEAFFNSQTGKAQPTFADLETLARQLNFDSYDDMWTEYTHSVVLDKYAQNVAAPGVSPEVRVRHILITDAFIGEEESAAARARAEDVLQQLRAGADFATLAAEYSEDPGSAAMGGLLQVPDQQGATTEWAPTSLYVPEFAEAASTLPIGQVSDLIETQFGYHIIEVLGRRSFANWQALNSTPEGQAIIDQTIEGYRQSGELKILIDPETIPLPPSVQSSQ